MQLTEHSLCRKKKELTTTLTKAEEQVMQAVWRLGKGFAGDIAAAVEEPKPAYRTMLTEDLDLEKMLKFADADLYQEKQRKKRLMT